MARNSIPDELRHYHSTLNIGYVCNQLEARQLRKDVRRNATTTDRYCYFIGEEQGKYRIRATVHGNNTVAIEAVGSDEHFMPRREVIELRFYGGPANKSRIRDALGKKY